MTNLHYVLIGQTPVVEPDLLTWARWFETAERTVARTDVRGGVVSTVFLGLDHNYSGNGSPVLFETMSFIDGESDDCERCSTWMQAEKQHRLMVEKYSAVAPQQSES